LKVISLFYRPHSGQYTKKHISALKVLLDMDSDEYERLVAMLTFNMSRRLDWYRHNAPERFKNVLRMEVETFDKLYFRLQKKLETSMFRTISCKTRLEAALM
jgi:hypothetical protein